MLCVLTYLWVGRIFPSLGVKGAAIATDAGVIGEVLVVSYVFLKNLIEKRLEQVSGNGIFNFPTMHSCWDASAFFSVLEVAGWLFFIK